MSKSELAAAFDRCLVDLHGEAGGAFVSHILHLEPDDTVTAVDSNDSRGWRAFVGVSKMNFDALKAALIGASPTTFVFSGTAYRPSIVQMKKGAEHDLSGLVRKVKGETLEAQTPDWAAKAISDFE